MNKAAGPIGDRMEGSVMQGVALMAAAMLMLPCMDAIAKYMANYAGMSPGQVTFYRFFFQILCTVPLIFTAAGAAMLRPKRPWMNLLRGAIHGAASLLFFAAVKYMPLADVFAIYFVEPFMLVALMAVFLKEHVGWRRWLAIAAGFAGVLIIIRPGPEGFSMAAIYVIASVIGAAARDLATRRIRSDVPSIFVSAVTAVVITLVGGVLVVPMGGWRPVPPDVLTRLALASALLLVGYQTLVTAMRTGEISFIAPFRYTSLIWAIAIGFLFFGEVPDFWMTVGVLVIVASGLYTFYRENLRRTKAVAQRSKPESP